MVDLISDFSCDCFAGFTGDSCDIDIDDCTPNPCGFGTCTDLINDYKCACPEGFTDRNCSNIITSNYCDTNPCQNNGSCTDGNDDYTCTCLSGYSGRNCQIKSNENVVNFLCYCITQTGMSSSSSITEDDGFVPGIIIIISLSYSTQHVTCRPTDWYCLRISWYHLITHPDGVCILCLSSSVA